MFYFSYDNYMHHAFPEDELKPISCLGQKTWGNYSLTLIDTLDTLFIMGNIPEFLKQTQWIVENVNFDQNVSVSVFETNIRVLGGLLSAAQIIKHVLLPQQNSLPLSDISLPSLYQRILNKAEDVGNRLYPAFELYDIPFGAINLKYGLSPNETLIASVAGGGTHLLEFTLLSILTGDYKFRDVAHKAAKAFYNARHSQTGLLGNHINIQNLGWSHKDSGIGSNTDSYYEYLYKAYALFGNEEYLTMFQELYRAIQKYEFKRPWYFDCEMSSGIVTWPLFGSLQAFFPGIQVQYGKDVSDFVKAKESMSAFHSIWRRFGAVPEGYNVLSAQVQNGQKPYPLRPELAESMYFLYRKTRDPTYLQMGKDLIHSLIQNNMVQCGFASLRDVETREKEDRMESFFLAETLKYLYLLFDEENIVNHSDIVFNTEGHILFMDKEYLIYSKFNQEDGKWRGPTCALLQKSYLDDFGVCDLVIKDKQIAAQANVA